LPFDAVENRAKSGPLMLRAAKWWMPTVAMTLLSLLSYVDRGVLAQLSPTILKEVGLTGAQYGWIISAFSAGYFLGNPSWGLVLDRYGLRVGLSVAVVVWTVASASHAFLATAGGFAIARATLGFGEGATFPAGLRTSAQTLHPHQRARGLAVAYSGGSLGAVLTPIIVTPIAARWGWRGAFWCTGLFGAAWLALWAVVSRDVRLKKAAPTDTAVDDRLPMDASVLGFVAAYAFGGLPLGFVLYQAPIFLSRHMGWGQATLGHVLWIPPLGWEVGYFFWGWIVDRSVERAADPDSQRRFFRRLFTLLAALALPLALTPRVTGAAAVLGLLFLAMFVSAGFVIASLAETTRRHAQSRGAYLAGLGAGSWSGLMALVMPVFGRLFDRGQLGTAFAVAALAPAVGWVVWMATGFSAPGSLRPHSSGR
jgi:ACS family hexuronate transporter-like MFS transporter